MPAREGTAPAALLASIKTRNAKSPIRETYSARVYDHFKRMRPVPFKSLAEAQQRAIMREEEAEGLYSENDPGTVRWLVDYIKAINYIFLKVDPDLLPKTFAEDVDHDVYGDYDTEAANKIGRELARMDAVEESIEKHGYAESYPVTIYLDDSTRKATVGYGNHRLQAVRNLIARGVLPRGFEVPVCVVYEDAKLKACMKRKAPVHVKACRDL